MANPATTEDILVNSLTRHRFDRDHLELAELFAQTTDELMRLPAGPSRHDALSKLQWSRNAAVRALEEAGHRQPRAGGPRVERGPPLPPRPLPEPRPQVRRPQMAQPQQPRPTAPPQPMRPSPQPRPPQPTRQPLPPRTTQPPRR